MADPVTARAVAVRNAQGHIAVVEVVDQEGLFNVYQERIRRQAAAALAAEGERGSGVDVARGRGVGPATSSSPPPTTSRPPTASASGGASQVTPASTTTASTT
ncbi:MAG: hypothetical protein JO085_12115 [Acidimicrobiia bacterium]|nr:hypothetical protein [Acidimicrobiia bacterium]